MFRCECGNWEVTEPLDIYKPKDVEAIAADKKLCKDAGGIYCIGTPGLKASYELVKEYNHICPECSKEMKKLRMKICWKNGGKGSTRLKCPSCGTLNAPMPGKVMWD